MNNEEARYRFQRTVAEVLAVVLAEERVAEARQDSIDILSDEQDEERKDDP